MKNTRTVNPKNERVKREYLQFLKHAKGQSEPTLDGVVNAIYRFESFIRFKDFKDFHFKQAVAFKQHLTEQSNLRTGEKISLGTVRSIMGNLKAFFQWLCGRSGFKSGYAYSDTEYFNLSGKDNRIATARRAKKFPTLEQMQRVLVSMPDSTILERRNQALIAFIMITGARDGAIVTMKLKHIDLERRLVFQDAREVNTKFSKTFPTFFMPIGEGTEKIFIDWVVFLRKECLWGNDDPLFPSTEMVVGANNKFQTAGIKRVHWSNSTPIRRIFKDAFELAGLPYFNPHSLRNMIVQIGERSSKNAEEFKAWSQNIGHEKVMTTIFSYGAVEETRQGEIIHGIRSKPKSEKLDLMVLARLMLDEATARNCQSSP
jgi:integrase/recombinase XerD